MLLKINMPIAPRMPAVTTNAQLTPVVGVLLKLITAGMIMNINITPVKIKDEKLPPSPLLFIMMGQIPKKIPVKTAFITKLSIKHLLGGFEFCTINLMNL
jgi:hypothetical protein